MLILYITEFGKFTTDAVTRYYYCVNCLASPFIRRAGSRWWMAVGRARSPKCEPLIVDTSILRKPIPKCTIL